jgi:hypothetical protein
MLSRFDYYDDDESFGEAAPLPPVRGEDPWVPLRRAGFWLMVVCVLGFMVMAANGLLQIAKE